MKDKLKESLNKKIIIGYVGEVKTYIFAVSPTKLVINILGFSIGVFIGVTYLL